MPGAPTRLVGDAEIRTTVRLILTHMLQVTGLRMGPFPQLLVSEAVETPSRPLSPRILSWLLLTRLVVITNPVTHPPVRVAGVP